MDTILIVQRDADLRRAWQSAVATLGVRVILADSLLAVPKLVERERISIVVAELLGEAEVSQLRWVTTVTALPPLVLVTGCELLPPLAARARGAAVIRSGERRELANAVEEMLAASRRPAMNLPLRLPQVCETKWTTRLRPGERFESLDTWPGDWAA